MIPRLARQALAAFTSWRRRKRLVRVIPELVEIDRQIETLRDRHRPIRRHLRAKRDLVLARMAEEQGKHLPERLFS
jgi:hypothetical protein